MSGLASSSTAIFALLCRGAGGGGGTGGHGGRHINSPTRDGSVLPPTVAYFSLP